MNRREFAKNAGILAGFFLFGVASREGVDFIKNASKSKETPKKFDIFETNFYARNLPPRLNETMDKFVNSVLLYKPLFKDGEYESYITQDEAKIIVGEIRAEMEKSRFFSPGEHFQGEIGKFDISYDYMRHTRRDFGQYCADMKDFFTYVREKAYKFLKSEENSSIRNDVHTIAVKCDDFIHLANINGGNWAMYQKDKNLISVYPKSTQ